MMKRIKFISAALGIVLMMAMLFTACGEDIEKTSSTEGTERPAETTVVLETTAQGGTVEQDAEGNTITKDSDGTVVSVVDKNGQPIEVAEYITTHSYINGIGSSDNMAEVSDNKSTASGSDTPKETDTSSSVFSPVDETVKSGQHSNDTEETIPVIIATLPDDSELAELPDL